MHIVIQLITSFIATAGFAMMFNAPRQTLVQSGMTGMLGWIIYFVLEPYCGMVISTMVATFMVGVFSQLCARVYKMPVIIFSVAGIIPLVPGGIAYASMRKFVENNYSVAVELAAQVFLISGSITVGLVLSEVLNQINRRIRS